MGGLSSKSQQDIKQYLSFQYITTYYPLIIHKKSNTQFMVHQLISQSSQQSHNIISDINLYKSLKCESISRIVNYVPLQSIKICSQQQYHYLLQENVPNFTLKEQFNTRKYMKEKFMDKQILQILKMCCVGVSVYENIFKRNFYYELDMGKIIIQHNNKQLRLVDPLLSIQQGNFNKILMKKKQKMHTNNKKQLITQAPQQYNQKSHNFNQSTINQTKINQYYVDLYKIGIIMLQLIRMQNFKISQKKDILMNQINSVQNVDLRKAIEILLSNQPQKRKMIFEYVNIDKQKVYRLQRLMVKMSKNKKGQKQIIGHNHAVDKIPAQGHLTPQIIPNSSCQSISSFQPIIFSKPSPPQQFIPVNSSSSSLSSTSFDRYNNITFKKVESNLSNNNLLNNVLNNNKDYNYDKNNYGGYSNISTDRTMMRSNNSMRNSNIGLNKININSNSNININSVSKKSRINFVQSNLYKNNNNNHINHINIISNNNIHHIGQNNHINQYINQQTSFNYNNKNSNNNNNKFSFQTYSLPKSLPNLQISNFQPIQSSSSQSQQLQLQNKTKSTQQSYKQPNKQVEEILKKLGIGSLLYEKQNKEEYNLNNNYEVMNRQMNNYDNRDSNINNIDIKVSELVYKKQIDGNIQQQQQQYKNIKKQTQYDYSRQSTPIRPTLKKHKYNSTIVQVGNQSQQQQQKLKQQSSSQHQNQNSSNNSSPKKSSKQQRQYVIQHYQSGSHYQGYKLNNKRDGYGKFYYQDGGYYEGEWKNNKMSGQGKLYYQTNKLAYQGQWKDDQFNGYGKVYNDHPGILNQGFNFTNFDQLDDCWEYYQGKLLKDTKQGRGKIMLTNGEWFEGDFHNDRIQGFGKFFMLDGTVIEGIWKDSKLIKVISS